ncbi:Hypothetical predicted protein [Octopus vulgaris]|uniref:Uncharacterized protein n=1 Tax=Octopus vulgaris TaxID=6645 RepID=A0AA36F0T2_OCTVU|nr:Hypothetical predicted protein [Octopus vulgaris]
MPRSDTGCRRRLTASQRWHHSTGLKMQIEGWIIAASFQRLATTDYRHRLNKDGLDPQYKICENVKKPSFILPLDSWD